MEYIIAGLMAAVSFLANKLFVKNWGAAAVVGISPFVEEAAKTLPAYYLGADIFVTHLIFGVIEGCYDWLYGQKSRILAALYSVAGHGLFGIVTVILASYSISVYIGLLGAVIGHIFWNAAVVRLTAQK